MSFRCEKGNITNIKCDAIVNSVGANTTIYGGVCRSILEAANSKRLENILFNAQNVYQVGDYFVTESYGLSNCKYIIHLITPFFKYDSDYKQYKECLRRILNECKKRGFESVAFPYLGSGANEYKDNAEVKTIMKNMFDAYCEIYGDMDLILVEPDETIKENNRERLNRALKAQGAYHVGIEQEIIKRQCKKFAKYLRDVDYNVYDETFFDYDEFVEGKEDRVVQTTWEEYDPRYATHLNKVIHHKVRTIGEYVERYLNDEIDDLYYMNRIYAFFAYDKSKVNQYLQSGIDAYGAIKKSKDPSSVSKKAYYRIAFALKMSLKETEDFLNYFGYTITTTGVSDLDETVTELLNNKQYDLMEIASTFKNKKIIFFNK